MSGVIYRGKRADEITQRALPALRISELRLGLVSELAKHVGDTLLLEAIERRTILAALGESGNDKKLAARMLGIGKTTLYRKLKEYSFDSPSTLVSTDIVNARETPRIVTITRSRRHRGKPMRG